MAVHNSHAATISSTDFRFTSADGLRVACARRKAATPVGVVQIADGMGEHIGRYAAVIEVLVSAGLTVSGNAITVDTAAPHSRPNNWEISASAAGTRWSIRSIAKRFWQPA